MPLLRIVVASAALGASALLIPFCARAQSRAGDGFMFGHPSGSFSLRGGLASPTEQSDLFSFVQKELTIGRGAFGGGSLAGDFAAFVSDRLAVQAGVGYSSRLVPSVYRKWVDNDDREIEQSSELRRMPLSLGLRYYVMSPGRTLGQLAWVPARVAPYVSAGVGATWYSFRQTGDFVDYLSLDVFGSTMESSAWAPSTFAAVGVDYALRTRVGLVAEARYDRAHGRMGSDFSGFNDIDLSGTAISVGLTVRF